MFLDKYSHKWYENEMQPDLAVFSEACGAFKKTFEKIWEFHRPLNGKGWKKQFRLDANTKSIDKVKCNCD